MKHSILNFYYLGYLLPIIWKMVSDSPIPATFSLQYCYQSTKLQLQHTHHRLERRGRGHHLYRQTCALKRVVSTEECGGDSDWLTDRPTHGIAFPRRSRPHEGPPTVRSSSPSPKLYTAYPRNCLAGPESNSSSRSNFPNARKYRAPEFLWEEASHHHV